MVREMDGGGREQEERRRKEGTMNRNHDTECPTQVQRNKRPCRSRFSVSAYI